MTYAVSYLKAFTWYKTGLFFEKPPTFFYYDLYKKGEINLFPKTEVVSQEHQW